jgi:hypothetical protein
MSPDFIADLIETLERVITPDSKPLKEVLIISGMPEKTENLRYLGFNRQVIRESNNRTLEFSAVAIINNRRIARWRLEGVPLKLSRIVFSTRWTRNPLDLYINNLRSDAGLMDWLSAADANYTLLGILKIDTIEGRGLLKRRLCRIRPVVSVPGIDKAVLEQILSFENRNEICKSRIRGLPFYRKTGVCTKV